MNFFLYFLIALFIVIFAYALNGYIEDRFKNISPHKNNIRLLITLPILIIFIAIYLINNSKIDNSNDIIITESSIIDTTKVNKVIISEDSLKKPDETKNTTSNEYSETWITPSDDDRHNMAYIQAKDFVKNNLKSPSSASFWHYDFSWSKSATSDTYYIKSYVDADNSYGANIKSKWTCKLKYLGGDEADINSWESIDVKIY